MKRKCLLIAAASGLRDDEYALIVSTKDLR